MKKFIKKNITICVALSGVIVISSFGLLFNKTMKQQKQYNMMLNSKENEIQLLKKREDITNNVIKKLKTDNVNTKKELDKTKIDLSNINKQLKEVSDELLKAKECLRRRYSVNQTPNLKHIKKMSVIFTFYTNLPEENGGYYNITSSGKKLADGMVASINELPIGSILISKKFGKLVVEDRMSRKVGLRRCRSGEIPVDVYVPRNCNESRGHYYKRVNNMGIIKETITVYY